MSDLVSGNVAPSHSPLGTLQRTLLRMDLLSEKTKDPATKQGPRALGLFKSDRLYVADTLPIDLRQTLNLNHSFTLGLDVH